MPYYASREGLVPTENYLTEKQLTALVRWWMPWLGLADWVLEVDIVRHHDLKGNARGTAEWLRVKRRGGIVLLDPRDADPYQDAYDMEHTLVHEMLHIAHSGIDDAVRPQIEAGLLNDEIEQFIDRQATALVTFARTQKTHPGKKRRR